MQLPSILFCVLLLSSVSYGQDECGTSELGYACRKQMTDYFALHWSLGPTTDGAEALEGEVAFAMVGNTEGWVGFGFADVAGSMAPADIVLGWVDGTDVVVTPFRPEVQNIAETDEDDAVELQDTQGDEGIDENGDAITTIQFVRSLTDGTTPIVLDEAIPVNVAIGDSDELIYHGTNRDSSTITLSLASGDADSGIAEAEGPSAEPEDASAEVPATETATEDTAEAPEMMPPSDDSEEVPEANQMTAEAGDGGCPSSALGYSCMTSQSDPVFIHWTVGPAAANGEVPEVAEGEVALAIVSATEGWVGISFAQSSGQMAPADAMVGWVTGETVTLLAYEITARSLSPDDASDAIGIREISGSEADGETTLRFVVTGEFTFPVDLTQTLDLNWARGDADSLVYHASNRGSIALNLQSGESTTTTPTLRYYRAHGACMIMAWIVLAPMGLLIARNKYAFMGLGKGVWFQLHRAIQILALAFMICGLIIALSEFNDPATEEGKRHRRVGISIITIGLVQGFIPFFRPHPDGEYRYIFNFVHWWLGRGAVILGMSTVFLGIVAFDLLNDDTVDAWWISCVVILSVYFGLAVIGEFCISYRCSEEEKMKPKREEPAQSVEMT